MNLWRLRGICFTIAYSAACNQTAEVEELQVAIGFLRCVVVVSVTRPLEQLQDFDEAQTFFKYDGYELYKAHENDRPICSA